MKRIIIIIATLCAAMSAYAQEKGFEMQVDLGGSKGIERGYNYYAGVDFIAGYRFSSELFAGVGAGFTYADALYREVTDGNNSLYKIYETEFLVPVFARLRFDMRGVNLSSTGSVVPFLQVDGGYNLNVGGIQPDIKGGYYKGNISKLFAEPQLGLACGEKVRVAVGIPFVNHNYNYATSLTYKPGEFKEEVSQLVGKNKRLYTNGISFHIAICL